MTQLKMHIRLITPLFLLGNLSRMDCQEYDNLSDMAIKHFVLLLLLLNKVS